jgi:hypothetical protein
MVNDFFDFTCLLGRNNMAPKDKHLPNNNSNNNSTKWVALMSLLVLITAVLLYTHSPANTIIQQQTTLATGAAADFLASLSQSMFGEQDISSLLASSLNIDKAAVLDYLLKKPEFVKQFEQSLPSEFQPGQRLAEEQGLYIKVHILTSSVKLVPLY